MHWPFCLEYLDAIILLQLSLYEKTCLSTLARKERNPLHQLIQDIWHRAGHWLASLENWGWWVKDLLVCTHLVSKLAYVQTHIHPNSHTSKLTYVTYIQTHIHPNSHMSKLTYIQTHIHTNSHTSKLTYTCIFSRDIGHSVQSTTSQVERPVGYLFWGEGKGQRVVPVVIGHPSLSPVIPPNWSTIQTGYTYRMYIKTNLQ